MSNKCMFTNLCSYSVLIPARTNTKRYLYIHSATKLLWLWNCFQFEKNKNLISFIFYFIIVFNNPKVQGKKTALEKIGEVVDIMKKSSSDSGQLLAGMKFMCKILDEEGPQERSTLRSDSAQSIR